MEKNDRNKRSLRTHFVIARQKAAVVVGSYPLLFDHPDLEEIGAFGWGPLVRHRQRVTRVLLVAKKL